MANEKVCVFCGGKLERFRSTGISCAGTYQPCCRECSREMQELDEAEWCRRALRLGLADYPEKLKAFIELADEAEARRPVCLQCGAKLKFGAVQWLDNSRFADTVSRGFVVLPARCPGCGRLELYDPDFIHNDPQLSYLLRADETN